jgi:glycine cleavage system aminomethyltransferase T
MNVPRRSPLHDRAEHAGARFVLRDGMEVPCAYGPVAAEIAACRASVGIADLSHLVAEGARIDLAGPRASELLAAAGELRAEVLRERDDRISVLCPEEHAERVWDALSEAGRPLRAAHVGVDALERLDAAASPAARG